MSRILAYFQPWAGHIYTVLPTLLELARRGHEVSVAVRSDDGPPMCVKSLSAEKVDVIGKMVVTPMLPTAPDGTPEHAALVAVWGTRPAVQLRELIVQERPDCLLVDPLLWGAMVAAEASGLPWVKIAYSSMLIPTTGFRLQGPGLPPPVRLRERLSQYVSALVAAKRADDCYLPMINAVRREHGVEELAHVEDTTRRAPLTLALTAEPFEYPRRDWHPSVRFVGPAIWEPPGDPDAFLQGETTPPLVLVSSSTLPQADARLVATALEALADEPVRVIATRPPGWDESAIPANARLATHVPHCSLLPYTTCVVCHAGPGTTQKALAAGVPVVAVPFGRDQFEVARRVEVADAGVRLPPNELTVERLRVAFRRAITKKAGAARIAAAFHEAGGAPAAAAAVETLVAKTPCALQ